ncbi:MAG TPA: ATP-binding protein [Cellvibrio sp.]|nr:ATP-binding protein [Cellvibrio sp.]
MKPNELAPSPASDSPSGIAKRLIISLYLGILIVLFAAAALHIYISFALTKKVLEKNLHQYALMAAPTFSDPLWNLDYNQTYLNIGGLLRGDIVYGAVINDEQGRELASLGNYLDHNKKLICKPRAEITNFTYIQTDVACMTDARQLIAITEPIARDKQQLGSITIYGNSKDIIPLLLPLLFTALLSATLVMLALFLVARLIIKKQIGKPLRELSQLISQLNYMKVAHTWRLPNSFLARDDELGELSRAFNDMVLKISTYQNHLEELVEERTEKLRIANISKSDFLSHMSHEIRTPINGVLGLSELMLYEKLTPEIHDRIEMIYKSGKYLLRIVNDILDLSKMEAGKLALESIPVQLETMVADVASVFVNHTKRDKIKLNINISSDIPKYVYADPLRLKQILMNLLGNAFKFTEQGSICLAITLEPDKRLTFSVSDTGIGIAPEKIEQLFQAFQQADSSTTRMYGGTGLGLTICRELVEIMGGQINAKNNTEHGCCFYFTLSLPDADGSSIEVDTLPADITAKIKGHIKILAADDQEVNQIIIKAMLGKLGTSVQIADNGKAVIDQCKQHPGYFDLILMDCEMPIMDGWETTRKLREMNIQRSNHQPILIIGLSAHATEGATERALASGMDAYLTKPLSIQELIAKLRGYDLIMDEE